MRLRLVPLLLAVSIPGAVGAQEADEIRWEYERRTRIADGDSSTASDRYLAAEAARYMRRFDEARFYLDRAESAVRTESDRNGILVQRLWLELASGGGIAGLQRVFNEELRRRSLPPRVVAGWVNNFPELLIGGQLDPMIDGLAEDAPDEGSQCACFAPKAWMHRVAGRMDRSRAYWDSLGASWEREPQFANPFDEADWRMQRARNYARAGHLDRARAELARAESVDVSAFDSGFIRRRRAQTYAELGDVDRALEDLEYLLLIPSPVTTHTLEARVTWSPIRRDPRFVAMLEHHRQR